MSAETATRPDVSAEIADGQNRLFMGLRAAAGRLGVSPGTLRNLGLCHALYLPDLREIPTGGNTQNIFGRGMVLFHHTHISLIEAVWVGAVDVETAWQQWRLYRMKRLAWVRRLTRDDEERVDEHA